LNFYIITLGCKVNQYESQLMSEILADKGYHRADDYRHADVCIINSCTVTSTGDAKVRKTVHRVRRENPSCIIVLCGCMPQAFSDRIASFDGCDIVVGNTSRHEIAELIDEFRSEGERIIRISPHFKGESFEPMSINDFDERTRAFVKIEDGCNRFCSYCIIPYARGRVRSKPLDVLRHEARELAMRGYRELVLVGINLSSYGQELNHDVYDAVCAVCEIDGIERVRLGSIEPERMTREMLEKLAAEPKFCPHFHLSLQAGCDATLRRMRRHYDTAEYARIVADIRDLFDHPAITTDVMVGFVGESDEDFAASLAFCDRIGFARTHVFPYSIRKGTAAEKMEGHLPEKVKHQRAEVMMTHAAANERAFLQSQIGLITTVLIESCSGEYAEGYTPNYTKVRIADISLNAGEIVPVRITAAFDDHCVGELFR